MLKNTMDQAQDIDDISSSLSNTTINGGRHSLGMDSLSSATSSSSSSRRSKQNNSRYKYDRVETLNLLKNASCHLNKSAPTFHLGNDGIEVVDDEVANQKALSNIESAKDMIKKLSSSNTDDNKSESTIKSSKSHYEFASTAYGVRMLSKDISNARVNLNVENLILVTKLNDISLVFLTRELVEWLLKTYPTMTVYVEDVFKSSDRFAATELCMDSKCKQSRIKYWNAEFVKQHDIFFDLCITLGGDGTVLFVSSLFQKHVPPTISFSLGSLGFLTNFDFEDFKTDLPVVLKDKVRTNLRMRLECKVYRRHEPEIDPVTGKKICYVEFVSEHHILNEITIDRGPSPFLSMLELYGDGSLLTVAQADGLIVATPTGSTAYSLSAGGSLVYPTVNAISVTPICPHTLSFRPIILPESMTLKIKVSPKARGGAWVAFDGKSRVELQRGDFVTVSSSPYVFPTVEASPTEFIDSISRSLNWNIREEQKSFTHMLSSKNREKFNNELCNRSDSSEEEYILEKKLTPKLNDNTINMSGVPSSHSSSSYQNGNGNNIDENDDNNDDDSTVDEVRVIRKNSVATTSTQDLDGTKDNYIGSAIPLQ
ncbi:NAD(+) kinase [Maudiozyma exigua]|uniref:NAD(+) kinase n=1 Tax=Maudiozyma exigua TaxID=34358 RepID=A0A9P7B3C1_MAUEX|nr:NAD(+) kinase [Kazachstania exigua]